MPDLSDPALTRAAAELMGWTVYGNAVYTDWVGRINNGQGSETVHIDKQGRVWLCATRFALDRREWRPLQDMNDAMLLVQKLQADGIGIELSIYPDNLCEYWILKNTGDHYEHFDSGEAPTPQRAIVLAALKAYGMAVGVEVAKK